MPAYTDPDIGEYSERFTVFDKKDSRNYYNNLTLEEARAKLSSIPNADDLWLIVPAREFSDFTDSVYFRARRGKDGVTRILEVEHYEDSEEPSAY